MAVFTLVLVVGYVCTIHTKWTQSRRREGEKGMLRIEDDVAARGEGPSKRITNFWREMK